MRMRIGSSVIQGLDYDYMEKWLSPDARLGILDALMLNLILSEDVGDMDTLIGVGKSAISMTYLSVGHLCAQRQITTHDNHRKRLVDGK